MHLEDEGSGPDLVRGSNMLLVVCVFRCLVKWLAPAEISARIRIEIVKK